MYLSFCLLAFTHDLQLILMRALIQSKQFYIKGIQCKPLGSLLPKNLKLDLVVRIPFCAVTPLNSIHRVKYFAMIVHVMVTQN